MGRQGGENPLEAGKVGVPLVKTLARAGVVPNDKHVIGFHHGKAFFTGVSVGLALAATVKPQGNALGR
jgi:hypothetical protein